MTTAARSTVDGQPGRPSRGAPRRLGRPDRHHARAVRLRHLRHRVGAGLLEAVLPQHLPGRRHPRELRRLRRRLRRPPARWAVLLPLRRPARPQVGARRDPAADGRLDAGHRLAAHLRTGRHPRAGPARVPAGSCRASVPAPSSPAAQRCSPRPSAAAGAAGRLARDDRRGAGHRAGCGGLDPRPAAARRGPDELGLEAGVPFQHPGDDRRDDHSAEAQREPRLPGPQGAARRAAQARGRDLPARPPPAAAGDWR